MITPNWQIQTALDAFIFDCDGTLSSIEGIDTLAEQNQVGRLVTELTADAMGNSGLNQELYKKRLDLVKPEKEQVLALGNYYFEQAVPDIFALFHILKRLNKKLYIVSAGLMPAVQRFGELLGLPPENIYAVNLEFDQNGHYQSFDQTSPLVRREGKREIVQTLRAQHPRLAYIGDGLNDLAAFDLVTRFIGYGGAYYRPKIEALCHYYIKTPSLSPTLALTLTAPELKRLSKEETALYAKGLEAIETGQVKAASESPICFSSTDQLG